MMLEEGDIGYVPIWHDSCRSRFLSKAANSGLRLIRTPVFLHARARRSVVLREVRAQYTGVRAAHITTLCALILLPYATAVEATDDWIKYESEHGVFF